MRSKNAWKISEKELDRMVAEGKIVGYTTNNPNPITIPKIDKDKKKREGEGKKYGNDPCVVDGIKFKSKKEACRYGELIMLRKAGVIGQLELQVPYQLNPGGTHSLKYIADFVYIIQQTGEKIVEDAKGHRTKEYKKKRRLMKNVHGISIKEV